MARRPCTVQLWRGLRPVRLGTRWPVTVQVSRVVLIILGGAVAEHRRLVGRDFLAWLALIAFFNFFQLWSTFKRFLRVDAGADIALLLGSLVLLLSEHLLFVHLVQPQVVA